MNMRETIMRMIEEYAALNGYPPTYREIAQACGLRSATTAWYHVQRLAEEGRLEIDRRRKIRLAVG